MTIFENAKVILPDGMKDTCVAVSGGRITDIAPRLEHEGAELIDCGGDLLAPGFVDIHVHGGGGREAMEGSAEAVAQMCRAHLAHGSTSMLPTVSAAPLEVMEKASAAIAEAMESGMAPNARGTFLEGPFLSPAQAGAQLPETLLTPADTDFEGFFGRCREIRMIGAAPELRGAFELGEYCAARGITVSAAHTDATMAQVEQAARHGFSDITHIYSGCSVMRRENGFRIPGVVEAGLLLDELTVQVIGDLRHLPAELVRLVYKCCGADRISLVTDALMFAGTELREGESYFQTNGLECVYEDGIMKMADRSGFCGSVATMDLLVRNMRSVGIPWVQVIRMASTTPARVAGLSRKGSIEKGKDADLVLLGENVDIKGVWLSGERRALT